MYVESRRLAPVLFYQISPSLSHDEEKGYTVAMWESSQTFSPSPLSAYFSFLAWERTREDRVRSPQYSQVQFQHIFNVRDIICENSAISRSEVQTLVRDKLSALNIGDRTLQELIILVIKLLLMVPVKLDTSSSYFSQFQLRIAEAQSTQAAVQELQSVPSLRNINTRNELPTWFNVIDLEKKVNIKIGWTDSITEHLTYQGGNLLLFRQVEALKHIEQSKIITDNFFSQEFIEETRQSIMLFFPMIDNGYDSHDYLEWFSNRGAVKDWHKSLTRDCEMSLTIPVSRHFEAYRIWQYKLSYLLEISNNQGGWTLKRCWYDDRDQALWWTRWSLITAVCLAIIFGLIQSITGIIQVVYAGHS